MNAPHPLSHLIQSIEDGQGWTDRELSRRINAAGHQMSHSYIGKLKNHPIQSVTATMVRALATGLGVSETVVAEAAMESMGVHIDTSSSAGLDVAIASEQSLTDYDKRLLRAVVKEMRTDGTRRTDEPQPGTPRSRLADQPQRDGSTTRLADTNPGVHDTGAKVHPLHRGSSSGEPREGDYARAADDAGPSKLEADDAAAARRGEESQDPGSDEPA